MNYVSNDEERAKLRKDVVSHLRSILVSQKGGVELERIKSENISFLFRSNRSMT